MKHASRAFYAPRKRVLDLARDLAWSGRYPDHKSIFAQLETMDGFADARDRLQVLHSQLVVDRPESANSNFRSLVEG
jgi:hypothetical protein